MDAEFFWRALAQAPGVIGTIAVVYMFLRAETARTSELRATIERLFKESDARDNALLRANQECARVIKQNTEVISQLRASISRIEGKP